MSYTTTSLFAICVLSVIAWFILEFCRYIKRITSQSLTNLKVYLFEAILSFVGLILVLITIINTLTSYSPIWVSLFQDLHDAFTVKVVVYLGLLLPLGIIGVIYCSAKFLLAYWHKTDTISVKTKLLHSVSWLMIFAGAIYAPITLVNYTSGHSIGVVWGYIFPIAGVVFFISFGLFAQKQYTYTLTDYYLCVIFAIYSYFLFYLPLGYIGYFYDINSYFHLLSMYQVSTFSLISEIIVIVGIAFYAIIFFLITVDTFFTEVRWLTPSRKQNFPVIAAGIILLGMTFMQVHYRFFWESYTMFNPHSDTFDLSYTVIFLFMFLYVCFARIYIDLTIPFQYIAALFMPHGKASAKVKKTSIMGFRSEGSEKSKKFRGKHTYVKNTQRGTVPLDSKSLKKGNFRQVLLELDDVSLYAMVDELQKIWPVFDSGRQNLQQVFVAGLYAQRLQDKKTVVGTEVELCVIPTNKRLFDAGAFFQKIQAKSTRFVWTLHVFSAEEFHNASVAKIKRIKTESIEIWPEMQYFV